MTTSAPPPPPKAKTRKGKKKRKGGKNAPPPAPSQAPWWIAAALGTGLLGLTVWAWPPRPAPEGHVVRGTEAYNRRQYVEALSEYESAPGAGPRNAGVHLDRGLARYRVAAPPSDAGGLPMFPPDSSAPEGLTRAQDEMRTAARGGSTSAAEDVDAFMRARAAYDLGNTFFTLHHWDNAIDAYKEALRLRPSWNDAAWNLELARRLRELERNPPDAGQDASPPDSSPDSGPPDAQDSGHDASDSGPSDGSGGDGSSGDGGGPSDGGNNRGDSGGQADAGSPASDGGTHGQDASAPNTDAAPPRSMAPLDDLDRTSRSLQNELLRRRGMQPRGPDDDR